MPANPPVDVQKLAKLAKIELTADEATEFGPQIASILMFVERLSELDTSDVLPMTTALDSFNQFRDDQPVASLSPQTATAAAPESEDDYFLVPPVLGKNG